ncbi:MAG: hypothetical protein ACRDF9_10160 [Candidatus Limnocylindria bacterium]
MAPQSRAIAVAVALSAAVLSACSDAATAPDVKPSAMAALESDLVRQRYAGYTPERAEQEGYARDRFCLDSASFGLPAERGAMGFHATKSSLLRGPIDAEHPQALLFDADGRVIGVEYEILAEAVPRAPELFGRTFSKLPKHAGVEHEHYALHVWFIDNPGGRFADFNPRLSCPVESTPRTSDYPGDPVVPEDHSGAH